jgi:sodium-dependent dicarboxylate transporter 2/3/5
VCGNQDNQPLAGDEAGHVTRGIGLMVALLFLVLGPGWALPMSGSSGMGEGLDPARVSLGLSIFAAVAVLWLTEALPLALTALLVPLVAALMNARPLAQSLVSFADPLIFLFLGGFALATALGHHGIDRWCARRILRCAGDRFLPSACLIFVATAFVSMWISNTATTAMILPLCLGLLGSFADHEGKRPNEIFLLLGVAYAASIGGLGTIVGSPPNGIVAKQLGLTFGEWMTFGVPVVAVLLPAMVATLYVTLRPRDLCCGGWGGDEALSRSSRPVLAVFLVIALLWAGGSWLAPRLGIASGYDTLVSLLGVVLLVGGRMITWEQFEKGTPWGVLLLFGGGLALGEVLKDTGASLYLARAVSDVADGLPVVLVVGVVVLFTIFLTELASNTAVAALMVPVFAAAAGELGVPAALMVIPLGLAASCAFMLPVATPPNALVYATGRVPQRRMLRAGFFLNLVCTVLLTLVAYFLLR